MKSTKTLTTLISHIGRYKTPAILTPVFTLGEVVIDVLIPYVTAMLIDQGILAGDMQKIYFFGTIMIGMAFLSLFLGIEAGRMSAKASSGFAFNLRKAIYDNIQTFSFTNIDKYSTSGLITRMTTDITMLQTAFQMVLRITVRAPFSLVLAIFMCLFINVRTSLIFIVALIILSAFLVFIINKVTPLFIETFKKYDALNASTQENIAAMRVVKAFVREDYESEKFNKSAEDLYKISVKAESLMAFMSPMMSLVTYGCIIAIAWFGSHYVVEGTLTTGELTSLFTYIMMILMSLMMVSMIFVMLTMSAASANRVVTVINEKADIVSPDNSINEVKDGSVKFENVSFSYEKGSGDYVISDINLEFRSGERIGVIGATASGKSSLVLLISRLYDVSKGKVEVSGNDVRDYDLKTLRDSVAVVLQQNLLFKGTILENLRWGNKNATLKECKEACILACADDFINQMPEGYNTLITQGGTNVSGGQRQRLCLARALLKHPKILILDDATSACDTATDACIRENLRTKLPSMTQIIISQRVNTVMECDRILVFQSGKVNGIGTHEELMEKNEIYKEFYSIQLESGGDFDSPEQKGGTDEEI
ncbi:MAG: ABC transporter ATP-binding protein [Bacteroidaceae bacterium]|nr:ABC transporter ATP-binding protein [Bacteroidaceae bacterium]